MERQDQVIRLVITVQQQWLDPTPLSLIKAHTATMHPTSRYFSIISLFIHIFNLLYSPGFNFHLAYRQLLTPMI